MNEEIQAADSLLTQNADLRAQLAALVEACEALAQFVERYPLARMLPTYYASLRVVGSNARAAVAAARPHADALLAELHAARVVVEAAREWREAVEQLDGVYAAEQALLAALKARE